MYAYYLIGTFQFRTLRIIAWNKFYLDKYEIRNLTGL